MTHAGTPEAAKAQRARRKARRLAAGLCLHGLCCPNTVAPSEPGARPHVYCTTHLRAKRYASREAKKST